MLFLLCTILEKENVDIIICGGGCSSMLLLYNLQLNPAFKSLKILVIEKEQKPQPKTWCFWHQGNHPLQHLITSSWNNIQFGSKQFTTAQEIIPFTYSSIKGDDFFDYFSNHFIPQFPNIEIVKDEVILIEKASAQLSKVICKNAVYTANTVFSSIIGKEFYDAPIFLWQHFKGWHIKTEDPIFDENIMTIMDFGCSLPNSFDFVYILPYSKNEALIEITAFSSDVWEEEAYLNQLNKFISQKLNAVKYQIVATEQGKIPMVDFNHETLGMAGETLIGTASGKIKASSGYGFEKMRIDAELLASNYFSKKSIKAFVPKRFKFYDKLLLKIILDNPEEAVGIFGKLFKKIPIPLILKFLYEETSLYEEALIFKKLPAMSFIKRIFN
ncbi:MAG TPA: lycopene cyclase family protein [Sediminibacterium sp.]|nr:lycopene cyclase family protein [Sediminibacterium sp.]